MTSSFLSLYLSPFLLSFAGALVLCFIILRTRIISESKKVRLGGVAVIFAFLGACLFDNNLQFTSDLHGFFLGGGCILIFGLLDDFFDFHWKMQLLFQILLICGVVLLGTSIHIITNPFGEGYLYLPLWGGIILTFIWFLLLMNAINWMDGVDGLSGGVLSIAFFTLFALSLYPQVDQPPLGILSLALLGAVFGFLLFNISSRKLFLGSAGIFFCAFALAYFSLFAGTKIATALLVLTLPIADALWVIWQRWRERVSIFQKDTRHLHYTLRNIGWSQRKILFFFYGVTVSMAVIALSTELLVKGIILIFVFLCFFFLFSFIHSSNKNKNSPV